MQNVSCTLKEYGGYLVNGNLTGFIFKIIKFLVYPSCDKSCSTFETNYLDLLFRFNDNTTYALIDDKQGV